ncbi:hypothetical protein RR46_13309 [Papilio xuthus]|uniref:Uncharacterized protein n=1 Tax=Papilio xuthus TaxID=66420 RepID=A0A194PGD4_PAPXU|nr:hypothetical protein RR46_13309 [Papilio xuthus]
MRAPLVSAAQAFVRTLKKKRDQSKWCGSRREWSSPPDVARRVYSSVFLGSPGEYPVDGEERPTKTLAERDAAKKSIPSSLRKDRTGTKEQAPSRLYDVRKR